MWGDSSKTVMIGGFVLASALLIIWMILFIRPSLGDDAQTLVVRFSDVDKVNVGTRVTYAGRPVGQVASIRQVEQARQEPADGRTQVFIYELVLKVDSSVKVYNTDEVGVRTSGLLGERSIAIIPHRPQEGQTLRLLSDEIIYAAGSRSVEDVVDVFEELSTKANKVLDEINGILRDNREEIKRVVKNAADGLDSFNKVMVSVEEQELVATFGEAAKDASKMLESLDEQLQIAKERKLMAAIADTVDHAKSVMESIDQPATLDSIMKNVDLTAANAADISTDLRETWPQIEKAINDLSKFSGSAADMADEGKALLADAREFMEPVWRGEGSFAKILKGDELYLRLNSLLGKADTLMNDVNHYGVLFHLNRGWQRKRTQRMNRLQALQTSHGFRNYFEDEVDTISTSVARVSRLMEKVEDDQEFLDDKPFAEGFRDLLQNIDHLREMMRLYNQSLVTPEEPL